MISQVMKFSYGAIKSLERLGSIRIDLRNLKLDRGASVLGRHIKPDVYYRVSYKKILEISKVPNTAAGLTSSSSTEGVSSGLMYVASSLLVQEPCTESNT